MPMTDQTPHPYVDSTFDLVLFGGYDRYRNNLAGLLRDVADYVETLPVPPLDVVIKCEGDTIIEGDYAFYAHVYRIRAKE